MADNNGSRFSLQPDEKVTSVMIYTHNTLAWGQVVTKEAIRVSTWLRTPSIPQYIYLHNAQVITFNGANHHPQAFRELHLPSDAIIGFHLKPPDCDPLDYDQQEPMRKMEPTTALVGPFRFEGALRMSNHTNLERYLDVAKETFTMMYDLKISQPSIPSMGVMHISMALIRNKMALFSPRTN
jgi:hypothetical protein